jgi:hypothetical protein
MPIRQYIKVEMPSADVDRLNRASCKALRLLDLVDRNDPLAAIIAKEIVHVGTTGVTDPQEIADAVVKHFRELR